MKRIVVTGPTGAIGMALIEECISQNLEVYAICRGDSVRKNRIPNHPYIHILECSLEGLSMLDVSQIPKCDVFFHLGWDGTVGEARNDMLLQIKNVQYTIGAVQLAHILGCTVFVGVGSQAEYGRVEGKLSETTPAFPENGYGMAKLCAGQMSRVECKKLGIRHIWARVLSVYGPYDNQASMIMQTIKKLLQKEKPLFTKCEQEWDYMFSQDAAKALLSMAKKGIDGKVYCVGSGEARRLSEYIFELRNQIDENAELGIGTIAYADKQVMYLCADIRELQNDTGFYPSVSFEEGIRKTIRWVKEEENTYG